MLLLLLVTPVLAHDIKGSMSWISLGPVNLQPAEFAKCIVALAVAKYMGRYEYKLRTWRDLIVPFALIGVPALIIMVLQKETGSALVFAAFMLVFYRQGMSGYVLWVGVAAVALFIISIRWGAIPLPLGSGSVGILTCMLLLTAVEIYFVCKEHKMRWQALILSGSVIVVYGICLIINIWLTVPFNWVSMGVVVALAIYTLVISVYWRKYILLLVTAFSLGCIGYTQACDFVFTRVLQPHQRIRIYCPRQLLQRARLFLRAYKQAGEDPFPCLFNLIPLLTSQQKNMLQRALLQTSHKFAKFHYPYLCL
jgi:rod shape determining protein RodA